MTRTRRMVGIAVIVLAAVAVTSLAGATPIPLPSPGTPTQVAAAVKVAPKINQLPSDLIPAIQNVSYDNAAAYFPATKNGCSGTTACVYGDTSATAAVALFGDSHAAMWLPALSWVGKQLGFRIVLLWYPGCPAADVTVWNASSHSLNEQCDQWRSSSISAITKLDPELVLLSDRTNDIRGANDKLFTNAAWQAGLETTIGELSSAKLKVAVIGDITAMTNMIPSCLAAYAKHIQRCSSPNPNPAMSEHVAAEMAAAKAKGAAYINPQSWLCTKTCSPVVSNLDVYYDSEHVSATYAAWCARLMEDAVKALLPGT
jgi:hypothetical protein